MVMNGSFNYIQDSATLYWTSSLRIKFKILLNGRIMPKKGTNKPALFEELDADEIILDLSMALGLKGKFQTLQILS